MSTRMQQRKGTAEQWTSINPILASGELGWESDTNKFKMGDGVNSWANLGYFIDQTTLNTSLGDYVEIASLGTANNAATLDGTANVPASQLGNVDFTGYATETYADTAESDAVSTANSYTDSAVAALVDSSPAALDTLNELAAALGDDADFATTVTNSIAAKADASHTHAISDVTSLQTTLDAKASLTPSVNAKTSGYTLTAADKGEVITASGTFSITVPGSVFSAGDRVDIVNIGTGVITISGSGATILSKDAAVTIDAQYAGATVLFGSPTVAYLIGAIA
jgi:hypothetical protein